MTRYVRYQDIPHTKDCASVFPVKYFAPFPCTCFRGEMKVVEL